MLVMHKDIKNIYIKKKNTMEAARRRLRMRVSSQTSAAPPPSHSDSMSPLVRTRAEVAVLTLDGNAGIN